MNEPSLREAFCVWASDWKKLLPTREKRLTFYGGLKALKPSSWMSLFCGIGITSSLICFCITVTRQGLRSIAIFGGLGLVIPMTFMLIGLLVYGVLSKYEKYREEKAREEECVTKSGE